MTREGSKIGEASFMWGGSISPPRPLRNLDGHGPVGVLGPAAAGRLEVQLLQPLGDGADAAGTYGAVVHGDHRGYLEAGAGQEDLVCRVQLCAADVALRGGKIELSGGEVHHRVAGYPLQDVRGDARSYELALSHQKDVGGARLGDKAGLGQEDRVVV